MTMKQFLTILITFVITFSFAQENKIWSLQECVDYAYENNISIKQGENGLLVSEQDIKAAKGNFLPSVSASANQSLNLGTVELYPGNFADRTFHSTSFGVNVSQNVFSGFRTKLLYEQSKLGLERGKLEQGKLIDDIGLYVVNTYLNILFNKENLETAKAQYSFSQKQLKQVQDLVDSGVQPRANLFDAEATLSNDEQRVTVAENNHALSLLQLSQLLQLPYEGFDVEVVDVGAPSAALMYDDISFILREAFDKRNEIKIAEKNIDAAQLGVNLSKSGYYPNVSLGYGFNTGANFSNLTNDNSLFQQLGDNRGHGFNLRVGIPIFSRFQNKTSVAKSKIQVENSKLSLEQAKFDLESTIQNAYTDAQAALKSYVAAEKSFNAQKLAFDNSLERYNIGAMNSYELEQARIRLLNAESSLINAKYDFVFKTKVLDFYVGKTVTF